MVDTNVARSASESQHPVSDACRQVLEAIMTNQHRVVLSATQYWEWQKHQSGYAKAWLTRMMGKKLHVVLTPEPDSGLADSIHKLECTGKARAEMLKDVHLLESALATDHAVVSQETNVLGLFITHAQPLRIPRPVAWVNPIENTPTCTSWLEAGAALKAASGIPAGV
ncbi:MAG: hypothetical protein EOO36_03310 [Cytophagaceae bacterium]|nr:MAG: hypothetical protein EOO36_03310 [Cytophagaceae bacterium]